MPVEICTVGGYNEVGKNMTAIKIDDEVIICDMGLHIENYIKVTEEEDLIKIPSSKLLNAGAVPDIRKIEDWRKKVTAIIPTHAHLDHVGAIPFLSNKFNAPILCTAYTSAVLQKLIDDKKVDLKNKIKILTPRNIFKLSKNIQIEFINMTHSTPQTVMIVIYTKYGKIIYANDFKFDKYPVVGKHADIPRIKEVGKGGILALICDSTYANLDKKMPSESVAREKLRDVLLGVNSDNKAVIITTFSSHIARLKSIIEFGKKTNRKIVFLGRSLNKYVSAAESINLVNFSKDVELVAWGDKIKKKLRQIMKIGKEKYLLVVTGHQGEQKAVLSKMINEVFPFKFEPGDHVIFSCNTIPTWTNIDNRKQLEDSLKKLGVRIFKEIHVSGHAAREDLRDLIEMVMPKHLIPAHGEPKMLHAMAELVDIIGLKDRIKVHVSQDGKRIEII